MGLYSVSVYMQNMFQGLTVPQMAKPVVAYLTPPTVDKADGPKAYVLGGRVHRSRQTAPRIAAFNKRPWAVDIYLAYLDSPDDARLNEPFPRLIDAAINVVETAAMPVLIDPDGNVVTANQGSAADTQIQAIGETWDLQYPPERMPVSLRQIWYVALLTVEVLEVKQG